ncbi:cupin domain-containing protein [Agromyces sp. M3QZ16-3]|uniref:cupin domain-containing protein n=1 Tax=Agromyces sp. M3QZ16-3 TaxID=3447585 RepID=UPI003F68EA34
MSSDVSTVAGTFNRDAAAPFEVATVQWNRRPGHGERKDSSAGYRFIASGLTPEPMEVTGHVDETVNILPSHLRIEPQEGRAFGLQAGDSASSNRGMTATWMVLAPTIEFFDYS